MTQPSREHGQIEDIRRGYQLAAERLGVKFQFGADVRLERSKTRGEILIFLNGQRLNPVDGGWAGLYEVFRTITRS